MKRECAVVISAYFWLHLCSVNLSDSTVTEKRTQTAVSCHHELASGIEHRVRVPKSPNRLHQLNDTGNIPNTTVSFAYSY